MQWHLADRAAGRRVAAASGADKEDNVESFRFDRKRNDSSGKGARHDWAGTRS